MTFWGLLVCLVNERTFTRNPSFQALLSSYVSYGLVGYMGVLFSTKRSKFSQFTN